MKPWLLLLAMPLLLWLPAPRAQDGYAPAPAYPPLEQFDEIISRPLFDESRRPQAGAGGDPISASAAAMREKWRLTGVVWEGDQQLALFSERQGEGRARIKVGMYLDGSWQLEEITVDAVTLSDGVLRLRLELWEPRLPSSRSLDTPANTPQDHPHATPAEPGEDAAAPDNDNEQGSNGESS
ncbi:hypothetical protein [Zobellella iuensis]|uniref:Type II secretion system protein GspC N-terminal domain-containing protein n=1 Tax=Zobellella iuensis TaxID=2803811 RepID=A0ABS1QYX8_9GAMM|nr:hypothetical protein [Zobellella iuensis]MBL1379323.1 hypothetical protein [Zobellella iuensis]